MFLFIGRLCPPPPANDRQAAAKDATPEPKESETEPKESESGQPEGPHIINTNKPFSGDSSSDVDVTNANPDSSDTPGDIVNVRPNSHTKKTTRMAPNCIVNWEDLKRTVDPHLGKCIGCKGSGLYLAEKSTCSFASTLEIVCGECNKAEEKSRLEVRYMKTKIENTTATNKQEKNDLRALRLKRDHKMRTMKRKFLPRRETRMICPVRNKKLSVRE